MNHSTSECDLLFGQSYYLRFDQKLWDAMQPLPPLGSLYATSLLRERGYRVAFFDAMLAESELEWEQALAINRPAIAVLFEDNFNYLSKMCLLRMRQAAFTMITMARQKGCLVIVAGADSSDHPEMYLQHGADYVLIGEGEQTLVELVDFLLQKNQIGLDQIAGLAHKVSNGISSGTNYYQSSRRPDMRNLDELPFPAWDLVDVERYRKIWIERHGYFSINLVTTRGCPFHCNWCAKPIWGQRYNVRSPENVVQEIEWLNNNFHPDYIWFVDDIFGLKPGWTAHFSELMAISGIKIPFKCLSRVDLLLRDGEIEALKNAGAEIVWVGAESGSQKILDAMEKGTNVEQIHKAADLLHQAGLRIGFFLQFGYPGESLEDIEKTLRMVRECQPDDVGMSVSYPLPGTGFYRSIKDQMGEKQNWFDSDDLAMLYRGPFTTDFYRQLHITLHREFRIRKAWRSLASGSKGRAWNYPGINTPNKIKLAGNIVYYNFRLPFDRLKLNRLSRVPHQGASFIPVHMSPNEAAQPTQQPD